MIDPGLRQALVANLGKMAQGQFDPLAQLNTLAHLPRPTPPFVPAFPSFSSPPTLEAATSMVLSNQFLPPLLPGKSGVKGFMSPFKAGWQFARVDQGVDYTTPGAIHAPLDGVVTRIAPAGSWAGGTGKAVYVRFNHPLVINGRIYDGFYSAETNPLVARGQHVWAGMPLTTGGSGEIGLTVNGQPATLVGGLGAGSRPTQAGSDLLALLHRRA